MVRRGDEGSGPHPVAMIQLGACRQVELRAHPKPEHRKLKGKAAKYGVLDALYVIALHALPVEDEELDIENALFGSEVIRYSTDPEATGSADLARTADGLWQRGSEHRATRVSAVLGAVEFGSCSVVRRWSRLLRIRADWPGRPFRDD